MSLLEFAMPYIPFKKPGRENLPVLNTSFYRLPLSAYFAEIINTIPEPEFRAPPFQGNVFQHWGKPFKIGPDHIINSKDFYLQLELHACKKQLKPQEYTYCLDQLAQFLNIYSGISWVIGITWLTSVANGRLVERNGFHISPIEIPECFVGECKNTGIEKPHQSRRYTERVYRAEVRAIYAPAIEFVQKRLG